MKTHHSAAKGAVEAAALSGASTRASAARQSTQRTAKPRDVFDCIAAGIPRADWELALDTDAAKQWSNWLGEDLPVSDTLKEAAQAQLKTKMLNLRDEVGHLDAARSALNAVATMTDECAFHVGPTLGVPAKDMANLLRVVHAELERRTQEICSAVNEVSMVWRVKA
ncbi:hypothetical protein [Comamonas testosteroni]|uniref:Uncharacterized protein n=1 Tax=Comamonas testosteroni TaxID=285 RepID=A0A8B4SAC7_COMTE|nr:hypothetical protein [Comamonas testosteroni]EHN66374.1 hypothetical protein CTATCC11996_07633 [Comamonas testosteroni ATCC 11996]QQN72076.1 hypothetical protein IYN88_12095 [Comamonas testosteroni]SUY79240.1 Uncharacterised protein [Comamonas testosteroni]